MSNRIKCPQCGRSDRIGRVRVVRECVDIPGGEVVRRDDPEWTHEYECGWCGWGEDVVGHCESCSRPILEDDDFEQWEDGPITHADCSVDANPPRYCLRAALLAAPAGRRHEPHCASLQHAVCAVPDGGCLSGHHQLNEG